MTDYIVVGEKGLLVRAQMDTRNDKNILRKMSKGEGFKVYQTYTVKGMSGLQVWGRVSDNPGGVSQEYSCLSIGNTVYAKAEAPSPSVGIEERVAKLETWARKNGYTP